jgi:TonB-linked SusC/RagA family outer membrane protein
MKNLKFKFILLLLITTLATFDQMYAQEKTIIRGKVVDSSDKNSVPGVSVVELDKDNRTISGTTTDMNGSFALKISNPKNKISFSSIGYKTTVEEINGRSVINISLEANVIELNTVEIKGRNKVNGGMMEVDERDLTSSISKINAKDLENIQAASVDEALQGRLAGVDIVSTSGDPGAGMSIRIRGTSSLTASSDPLIVIDGVPSAITVADNFDFGSADEQSYSQLLNIPMGDIKDITVLKDAAATAVWGSQAANGVLMITTKRGSKSIRPQVSISAKNTISKQPSAIPMLSGDQYKTLMLESYMNSQKVPLNTETFKEFANDPNNPYYFYNYGQNTNWIDAITQLGYIQSYNLAVSGGGDKTKYRASVDYNGNQGTTIGTYFNRLTARVNLDYNVSDRLLFRADIAYSYANNDRNYVNSKDNYDNVRSMAYFKMPNMSIYEYDINGNRTTNYFTPESNFQGAFPGTYNPVALAKLGKNNIIENNIVPSVYVNYDAIPGILKFTSNVAFTLSNSRNNMYLPREATGVVANSTYANRATESETDGIKTITISKLLYTPKLGENHSLINMLMFQTESYHENSNGIQTTNTASSELQDPSTTSLTSTSSAAIGSFSGGYRSVAAMAQVQYKLLDRYIIMGSIRADGSSKFGSSQRYGFFPSVSGRWRISGEPFFKNIKFVDDLSLRGSYGSSGNSPKNYYDYVSNYESSNYTYLGYAGVSPSSLELSNYRWERVLQTDIGLNLEMFDHRINIDMDWYRKRTKDLIINNLEISSVSGFSNMDLNAATMDNQGFEITIDATIIKKTDLTARFTINASRNDNLIRSVSKFFPTTSGSYTANGSYYVSVENSTPFGSFYGYKYKGVYKDAESTIARDKFNNYIYDPLGNPLQTKFLVKSNGYVFQPGDAMYEDVNHDGSIDGSDVVWLGDSNPRLSGGFGPTVTYKNLTVNIYFHYRLGNDIINRTKMNLESMYNANNQSTAVLRRWRNEGDVTDIPRALYFRGYNYLGSDRFVEDGSFLRLKYITLSYRLKNAAKKLGLNSLSAYCTINNLYTWTNYSGQDPEVTIKSTTNNRWAIGYDDSRTPPTKGFTIGLDVQF